MEKPIRIEIDEKLFKRFKARCAINGVKIKWVITELIKKWLKEK